MTFAAALMVVAAVAAFADESMHPVTMRTPVAMAASGDRMLGHVHTGNVRIREVLSYAIERSPSFRDLLATLNLFDRVVYVEEGPCRHREQRGCVQLMRTPGGRNLLVHIDPRQPINAVVGQLAHELYHAMEIAREPNVVNPSSMRELYRRIGEHACFEDSDDCWETRAALAFEALVLRQLHDKTASPRMRVAEIK